MDADNARDVRTLREFQKQLQNALQPFDTAREWADLSACLVTLRKVISKAGGQKEDSTRMLLNLEVDLKRLLGRRLAQCLNASLPSGVHMKTMEIYDDIFVNIGSDGLVQDLAIYSSGIFPFVQNASINVKITTITLFEKHYIPLNARLQPCVSGLIVALLPCIEDDKSQVYDRVCALLVNISHCVGERAFCYALWVAILKTSRVRLPALMCWVMIVERAIRTSAGPSLGAEVSQDLNQMSSATLAQDDVIGSLDVLSDDVEKFVPGRGALILQALETSFESSNNLVKRAALDALIQFLPMNSHVFSAESKVELVRFVLRLLNKHDWSLTRRITNFFTANASADVDQEGLLYFSKHVRCHIVWSFRADFTHAERAPVNVVAFKTLINLLDALDCTAESVMEDLIIPILIYIEHKRRSVETATTAIAQGKMLFDPQLVNPSWVWSQLLHLWSEQSSSRHPGSCMQALVLNAIYMDELLEEKGTKLENLYALLARALLS